MIINILLGSNTRSAANNEITFQIRNS